MRSAKGGYNDLIRILKMPASILLLAGIFCLILRLVLNQWLFRSVLGKSLPGSRNIPHCERIRFTL